MKLSTNFLKDYVDVDIDLVQLAEDMTKAGNEYDSAEPLINATKLIIGKVLECVEHPDSDHLHVCKVDIGNEVLGIVCGAPNVKAGIKVIVALAGAKLPGGIEIKNSTIRGVDSHGMICSLAELGIESKYLTEEDKNGIHILPEDAPIGKDPIKYLELDDGVIDFDLTANRGDLLSILGMAYEVGAIYDKKVKPIDLKYTENSEDINNTFGLNIKTDNCSLFLARKVKNVTIEESPTFIKNRLIASGIRPINNVVDISNYVMLETGQPLHFYDADKLQGVIEVRMAEKGEKLTTLDGVERSLSEEDIVISDGTRAIGLAGVMGGYDTEITEDTQNIIIETAIFDSVRVRKTSNSILRSEASNRFEKGLDPARTYMASKRACALLEKYANGTPVGGVCVYDKTDSKEKTIDITVSNITNVLGLDIPQKDILNVFDRLGFTTKTTGEKMSVTVPTRRIDISIKEDLIEEVGRIYGVDNIIGKLPNIAPKMGSYDKTTRQIRNKMVDMGLNETLTYILTSEENSNMFTMKNNESIKLLDPLSEEKNTLRQSIATSLYGIYDYNKSYSNKDVSIFEIAKVFHKENENYVEENHIAALMTGAYMQGYKNRIQVDFYIIKGIAEELLDYLGYNGRYSFVPDTTKLPDDLHPGQSAIISVNNDAVGFVGRVHPGIDKDPIYVLEINLDRLLSKKVGKMKYKELSKYPSIKKDLAFVVDKDNSALDIAISIKKAGGSKLQKVEVFDVYEKGLDENKVSIAYSLTFENPNATMTDEEINSIMEKIIATIEKKGAELRK